MNLRSGFYCGYYDIGRGIGVGIIGGDIGLDWGFTGNDIGTCFYITGGGTGIVEAGMGLLTLTS